MDSLLGGAETYVLKVAGDSMIAADILDGDLVFLRHQETAENGDIVSALIDGEEATLKRFAGVHTLRCYSSPRTPR